MTDVKAPLSKSRLKEKELCDSIRTTLLSFNEIMKRFLQWKDEILQNESIDKGFMQALAIITSQIYLGKAALERSVMDLVDYTVKGIEQQSNQEIWFSDKTMTKPATGAAAAREFGGAGSAGMTNWIRIAARIKIRLAMIHRTQLLTNMARQLALEEARADQTRSELEHARARVGIFGLPEGAPGQISSRPSAGKRDLDIDFSQPLISAAELEAYEAPARLPSRSSAVGSEKIPGAGAKGRVANVGAKPVAPGGGGGGGGPLTQAVGGVNAPGGLKKGGVEKKEPPKLPRTISFANTVASIAASGATYGGSTVAPSIASNPNSVQHSLNGSALGDLPALASLPHDDSFHTPQPSVSAQALPSPSPKRRSRLQNQQNANSTPLGHDTARGSLEGGALPRETMERAGPGNPSMLASMDDDHMSRDERASRAESSMVFEERVSEYSAVPSDRGDDDEGALSRPVFTTAANFENLDELLLHRSDEQEIRMTALKRRTNEAAKEVEGFFHGARTSKPKHGRRGSILGPGSSIDDDGTPRNSIPPPEPSTVTRDLFASPSGGTRLFS